jgi:hypothetical protein
MGPENSSFFEINTENHLFGHNCLLSNLSENIFGDMKAGCTADFSVEILGNDRSKRRRKAWGHLG